MPYFGEPGGRVKIQTTSKNSQRYYTTKRLVRDLLSNTSNWLQGMRDRSMRSGTELAREIKLTDWSMAGNLFNRSSGVQIPRDISTVLWEVQLDNKKEYSIILVLNQSFNFEN